MAFISNKYLNEEEPKKEVQTDHPAGRIPKFKALHGITNRDIEQGSPRCPKISVLPVGFLCSRGYLSRHNKPPEIIGDGIVRRIVFWLYNKLSIPVLTL